MYLVNTEVGYIKGHNDTSVSGSRSFLAPACGKYYMLKYGTEGHIEKLNKLIEIKNDFIKLLHKHLEGIIEVLPHNKFINVFPIKINLEPELLDKAPLNLYHLRSEILTLSNNKKVRTYKICVFPHMYDVYKKFIKDILMLKNYIYIENFDNKNEEETIITPWEVSGIIDYNKMIEQFGVKEIDLSIISKIEKIAEEKNMEIHPWIKREIFFAHRDLDIFIDAYLRGEEVYLYTGRGPSSDSMHLGHYIPFAFTKWLQDLFDCILIIQISDEEKYAFKDELTNLEEVIKLGYENSKDIISFGFNPKKTFIFSNYLFRLNNPDYEKIAFEMKVRTRAKEINNIFGFNKNNKATIAWYDWPIYQCLPAYYQAFPKIFNKPAYCLVPYAIDQDPYFRLARDLAVDMNFIKPCSIMSKFLPPLIGFDGKMSSSIGKDSTIFLDDDKIKIFEKIKKYAFSGSKGNGTLKDHRKYGGDIEKDISYIYLTYFNYDNNLMEEITKNFKTGEMSCSEIKKIASEFISKIINEHKKQRSKINDDIVSKFYSDNKF